MVVIYLTICNVSNEKNLFKTEKFFFTRDNKGLTFNVIQKALKLVEIT